MKSTERQSLRAGLAVLRIFLAICCLSVCHAYPSSFEEDNFLNMAITQGAPWITPLSQDITLEQDSNYTLKCESNSPITWHLPIEFSGELSHKIQIYDTLDPERPIGSQLTLMNIRAKNVGYYYCIKAEYFEDAPLEDETFFEDLIQEFKASRIYIFVNDLDNLLVPYELPLKTVNQYEDVTIPCKPTSKDIAVELVNPHNEIFSSDTTGRYDPKRGFVIQIRHITDGGEYICKPKHPSPTNEDEEFITLVQYRAKTYAVNKPKITSESNGHVTEGDDLTLVCTVDSPMEVNFDLSWILPRGVEKEDTRIQISKTTVDGSNITHRTGKSMLNISNASRRDSGNYKCLVRDHSDNKAHNTYLVTVLKPNESYINISEPNNHYSIVGKAQSTVQLVVKYRGYPALTLNWFKPDGTVISPSRKFEISQTSDMILFKINEVLLDDSGVYQLIASNGIENKSLDFSVLVKDRPMVSVSSVYVQAGDEAKVVCQCDSYPRALVTFVFTPCAIEPKWPNCSRDITNFNSSIVNSSEVSAVRSLHEVIFKPEQPGRVTCFARNELGNRTGSAEVLIGDISENMTVYGVKESDKIAIGDEVVLTCAALAYFYSADLGWYKDNVLVEEDEDIEIVNTFSEYSYKKALKFKSIREIHKGSYECRAVSVDSDTKYDSKYEYLEVFAPQPPELEYSNLGKDIKRNLGEMLELKCVSHGIPNPKVTWYKDDLQLHSNSNISIEENDTVLKIPFIKPDDEGIYKCAVANRLGSFEMISKVKIANMPGLRLSWIIGIIALILVLIAFIIYLCIRVIKEREQLRQMKAAGLANFQEGAVEHINPALCLDEQADLLPYDTRFEFPREKLHLGKQLGAGAFGVVLKATAEGISPDEKETIVAVKKVKGTADNEVMKALVSELKIMVHLGQHLNVVNLLGAVTKNIAKREVLVIVEYCRFGNVQNFLLKNRKRYINQINPDTDRIDPSITEQRYSGDYEYNSSTRSDNDPRSGTRAGRPNSRGYVTQSDLYDQNIDSCATEQTMVMTTSPDDDAILSNNSVQPAWRSNYKPDTTESMEITTSHLVSWAFQVARGMDYLASRKVLHGDLAARNILLCEDNVVKICDFGLARSMYKSDNYKKEGKAPLPIKWLALESLSDQVFSTYTDIWSFGIVLWEFFSLAKVPYPGMDANQLYTKLRDGYRMEKPPYANQELYTIMLECWSVQPEARPLFCELERKFARLLEEEVTSHYLDLNEPYMRTNEEYFRQKDTDYLAMMGPPDEMAPRPPRYVNGKILPEIRIEPSNDYMHMNPKAGTAIFSPTRPKDDGYVKADHFTFPDQPNSPTTSSNLDSPASKHRKKTNIPEEIPMLTKSIGGGSSGLSDSEAELSPDPMTNDRARTTFAHLNRTPSPLEAETRLTGGDENYVNVKPAVDFNRKYLGSNGTKDAFSNPSYLMLKTVNEGRK